MSVVIAGVDAAVTDALGWNPGRIPGAQVTIRRIGDDQSVSATTDSTGVASFARLLPGTYTISTFRQLGATEQAKLTGTGFADVQAFGGGETTEVSAPADTERLETSAGRPGSLVFSEVFQAVPIASSTFYRTGQYIELFNNSDTTIYLDGKLIARGMWYNSEGGNFPNRCTELEPWRTDPRGIWSGTFIRFPGSGRENPVASGRTVLVAMDAVDHRPFAPGLQDLTIADFEYVGDVDVDNPAAKNVEDVGPTEWVNVVGNGMYISSLHDVLVLAEALDESSLVQENLPVPSDPAHQLLPASAILDVVSWRSANFQTTYCSAFTNVKFDRLFAPIGSEADLTSIQRRELGRKAGGVTVLQRTRTSSADLYRSAPTPGEVP